MFQREKNEPEKFDKSTPTYIMGRKLNPIEKKLFYLKSTTINILLHTMFAAAFTIPATLLIKPQSLGTAETFVLVLSFSTYMLMATILIQEKIFISSIYMFSKKLHQNVYTNKAVDKLKKTLIVNHETFTHYTNISFNVKLLLGTSGEPMFDELKRSLSSLEPDIVFTLDNPTIEEVFSIIEKCEFKEQPVCFYAPFTFTCFNPEDRRRIYERVMDYDNGDPFKQKAIRSQKQEKIDKELEELIEKPDSMFETWSE